MILVDYSPVLISCAHSAAKWDSSKNSADFNDNPNATVEAVHMFRMLNTLRNIRTTYKRRYGEMVICVDSKPYWRSKEFPHYKKNRKPLDRGMDWTMFFENGDEIREAASDAFGWKVIDVPGAEADDIIATLCFDYPNEQHLIVSPDGDFKQLQKLPNVTQYDTIRNKKIIEKDPKAWLREKIICGDKKDGIPNIVSEPDIFMTGGRQTSIRAAQKRSWISADNPLFFCTQEMLERYKKNEALLDLSMVPEEVKDKIREAFKQPVERTKSAYTFFAEKGITRFLDNIREFTS